MKVILLRDVARLGKRSSIIEVPDGFALNKLIPQGMAQPATPENVKRVQAKAKEAALHTERDASHLKMVAETLRSNPLILTAEANAQDHLFKTIRPSEISEALKQRGITLEESHIITPHPIKALGEHEIQIVGGAVKESITISINRAA